MSLLFCYDIIRRKMLDKSKINTEIVSCSTLALLTFAGVTMI